MVFKWHGICPSAQVPRIPDVVVELRSRLSLDCFAHDLGFGPEGVDQWIVLNNECEDEKRESKAREEEFFVVGEDETKPKDRCDGDEERQEESYSFQIARNCG